LQLNHPGDEVDPDQLVVRLAPASRRSPRVGRFLGEQDPQRSVLCPSSESTKSFSQSTTLVLEGTVSTCRHTTCMVKKHIEGVCFFSVFSNASGLHVYCRTYQDCKCTVSAWLSGQSSSLNMEVFAARQVTGKVTCRGSYYPLCVRVLILSLGGS